MLLGIDVGGTFTDAVVLAGKTVMKAAKTPTTSDRLMDGILTVLDQVLHGVQPEEIERVSLSTTVVTNALVQGHTDKVRLLMMSGPGMDLTPLLPTAPHYLEGYVDHRGRAVSEPREEEVRTACRGAEEGCFAVSGKFSIRNPVHERNVVRWIRQTGFGGHISMGAEISGTLNYLRRTNSAYYNAAVWRRFEQFAAAMTEAMRLRQIAAPVYILKADGGTMPLQEAAKMPVETVFTGPAASVLGVMAAACPEEEAVSLDIGGTTTDIALWRGGVPLFAPGGAMISGYPTAVRSFWLRSVGLGGDSWVRRENGRIAVGPLRKGAALALGGPEPAVTDALIVAGLSSCGAYDTAAEAMSRVALPGQTPTEAADEVLTAAVEIITSAVGEMLEEKALAPVYRVDDIIRGDRLAPQCLVGVGGAAAGLAPLVAKKMQIRCNVPDCADVANAIGAAVARPTMAISLRADTAQGYYAVPELGLRREISGRRFDLAKARETAVAHLHERAENAGISADAIETVFEEEFNLVRGFSTTGKVISCRMQIRPGILAAIEGGSRR